ncbi:MAG: beta-ketoacyl-[acyl-carrier-protein] synthase family protein [Spirochaetes bacterium]|nr:beta-ketoacyl-[acyl-carrier-protein] synthase family protein [Spirochaetota bacterium]
MNKVFITAYSVISAIGIGIEESLRNLENQKQFICYPDKKDKFTHPYFPVNNELKVNKDVTRSSQFALTLLSLIEEHWLGLTPLPVFMATSTGGIKETEEVYTELVHSKKKYPLNEKYYFFDIFESIKNKYKDKITEVYTFSTACSSAGHSIMHAYRFIKNGIIDKALVIGVDALSITTMIGFDALKLVSPTGTKPLTKERDGLSLGEGGAIILLESNPHTNPAAEIIGVASNSDGYHITSPNPDGTRQKKCILKSFENSKIKIEDIDYINAHGTGTPTNDEIEMNVIKSIFSPKVIVSSLKGFIGHTLGSSAITELVITLCMLKNKKIYQPKNMGETIDENYVPHDTTNKKVKYFLKNSFGFGGNNVSMIVKNKEIE